MRKGVPQIFRQSYVVTEDVIEHLWVTDFHKVCVLHSNLFPVVFDFK